MRSPGHLEIKAKCKAAIVALMKKHGLGEPVSVRLDETGWVNPCIFVNETHVFRFNARDVALPKFQREARVFARLRDSGIPVPQRVVLDDSKEQLPFDVLISEMLPGENLESRWLGLDSDHRQALATSAGKLLGEIHQVSFSFFGEIAERGPLPRTGTWTDYLKAKFENHLGEAADLELFDEPSIVKLCEAFSNSKPALAEVEQAVLVHGDFHLGNLLFRGREITGVLDFEWAFAGDPLYDFGHCHSEHTDWPGCREPLLKAAGKSSFTTCERKRLAIYQLMRNLELCSVATKYFSAAEATEFKAVTLRYLDQLSTI